MLNQYGYETTQPNPPWNQRDQQCKCEECGCTWVGVKSIVCSDCANKVGLSDEGDSNADPK